jgi:hypothetical protein
MTLAGLDDDVIDISFHISAHLSPQGLTHEPLESCSCVLQAEGHADVAVHLTRCDEGTQGVMKAVFSSSSFAILI